MSDIRFNQWLHNSGTGGVSQVDGGHVGIGTTNPLIPVGAGNTSILNVGVVTANSYYGSGANLTGIVGSATSLSFNDNIGAYWGNSQDLKIHHDGNHSYIDDQGTGNLRLRSGTLEITNLASNKTSALFSSGGGQTLNFNNSAKFATTNTGVVVTGIVTSTSRLSVGNNTTNAVDLEFGTNRGSAGQTLANINWKWNNTYVAQIRGMAGSDTTNKDDAHLTFYTAASGSLVERLRILSDGKLLIGSSNPANNARLGNELCIVGTEAYTGMSITNYPGTNAQHSPMFDFNRSRGTSDQSMTSVIAGDKLGELIFRGSNGSSFTDAVTLRSYADSVSGTTVNGRFEIGTTNGSHTAKMIVSREGYVTKPNNPAFIAGRTGGNQTFTLGTFPLNVARLNVGNHYNTSTYKFVVPVAGVYYFYAQVYYNNGAGQYRMGFRKTPSGGSAFMLNTSSHKPGSNDTADHISIIESLAVNDTVELYSDSNYSIQCYYNINDATYGAHTYFMGYLIG